MFRIEPRSSAFAAPMEPVQKILPIPHPHGKVPAIKDGEELIFESSAIALFLTDKYPAKKMGPRAGEPGRGAYLSWLAYRPGVMEPALIARRFEIKHVYGAMGWAPADEVEEVLNKHLRVAEVLPGGRLFGGGYSAGRRAAFHADGEDGEGNAGTEGLCRPNHRSGRLSQDDGVGQALIGPTLPRGQATCFGPMARYNVRLFRCGVEQSGSSSGS